MNRRQVKASSPHGPRASFSSSSSKSGHNDRGRGGERGRGRAQSTGSTVPRHARKRKESLHGQKREKAFEFQIIRRVEFCDTDLAGIMHFSNFFRFMEAAETAFLRSLGLSVLLSRCGLEVCLPRVHAECDYRAPLQFEDEVLIHLLVERKGTGSLTYQFRFYRVDDDNREVARGRLVLACAAREEDGALKPVPLPKALVDKIQQAPAQALASSRSAAFTPLHVRYAQRMPETSPNHSNGGARRLRRFASDMRSLCRKTSTTQKNDAVKRRKRRAPK